MDWKRDRHRTDGSSDKAREAEGLPPGKRTATGPSIRDVPVDPGKRTPTQSLRFDPAASFEDLYRAAHGAVVELDTAVAERDLESAVIARAKVTRHLDLLRQAVARSRSASRERRARVDELESRAQPLVAEVPEVTEHALRGRFPQRRGMFTGTVEPEGAATSSAWDDQARRWKDEPQKLPGSLRSDLEAATGTSLGDVSLHAGPHGAAVARDHAARAVTIHSDIFFAEGEFDLSGGRGTELLAHEVAHVAQAGGHGAAAAKRTVDSTDAAELEADGFASDFANRRGAVRWSPSITIPAGTASRKSDGATSARIGASEYITRHWPAIMDVARQRLSTSTLTPGDPRLTWASGVAGFVAPLAEAFGSAANTMDELLYPNEPWRLVNEQRTVTEMTADALGSSAWSPNVGAVLGAAIELAFRASLPRMSTRYATAVDAGSPFEAVPVSTLVVSRPFDRIVAHLLCRPGAVTVGKAAKSTVHTNNAYDVQRDGLRLVEDLEWLGEKDPSLWNWVRVNKPNNATAEEVAEALWPASASVGAGTQLAYALTVSGTFFGVPEAWARKHPGFQKYAPKDPPPVTTTPEMALAASTFGDEAALQQATSHVDATKHPVAPDRKKVLEDLDNVATVLDFMHAQFDTWNLGFKLRPASQFAKAKRIWATSAAPAEVARWAPVFERQHAVVTDASNDALKAFGQLKEGGFTFTGVASPVTAMLSGYGEALGTSHLADSARQLLTRANRDHDTLSLRLVQGQVDESRRALATLPETADRHDDVGTHAAQVGGELRPMQADVDDRIAKLRMQAVAGGKPDAATLDDIELDVAETGLRSRIAGLELKLDEFRVEAEKANDGTIAKLGNMFSADIWALPTNIKYTIVELQAVEKHLFLAMDRVEDEWMRDGVPSTDAHKAAARERVRPARHAYLADARKGFDGVLAKRHIDEDFFKDAEKLIRNAAIRKAFVEIAALVGVSILSSGVATMAGEFAAGVVAGGRGVAALGEAVEVAATARRVGAITNFVVDATANAVGQSVVQGQGVGSSVIENIMTNGAVIAALAPLHRLTATWGALDGEAFKLWRQEGSTWKIVLAKGADFTAEMVTATAMGYVTHRVMHASETPDDQTLANWAMQGGSMALGKFVHVRLDAMVKRLGLAGHAAGELLGRARQQYKLVANVEASPKPETSLDVFAEHTKLQEDELAFWKKLEADPDALKASGMRIEDVKAQVHGVEGRIAETHGKGLDLLPLRFSGLDELVPGLWTGTHEQIQHAIAEALQVRNASVVHDEASNRWKVRLGDHELELRERVIEPMAPHDGSAPGASTSASAAAPATPHPMFETHAEMIPGSSFRGRGTPRAGEVLTESRTALQTVLQRHGGVIAVDEVDAASPKLRRADDRERAGQTFVVTLKTATGEAVERITIRIAVGPLEGETVAKSVLNPTQQGFSPTKTDNHQIKGRYVIGVSNELAASNVERAVAHEVAEILEIRRLNAKGLYPGKDALRPDAKGTTLSPDDIGRLAELDVLAEHADQPHARQEIVALVEYLGMADGTEGTSRRIELARARLGKRAIDVIDKARNVDTYVSKDELTAIRSRAAADRQAEAERASRRANVHDMPSTLDEHGRQLSPEALHDRAVVAAAERATKSEETWGQLEQLHAQAAAAGTIPTLPYSVQCGGGASLAGRNRNHLLVDDRNRWQADGNKEIAQTGHQLRPTKDARLGDPTEVVAPNARLPLDAVRYWEDHIAAQGPVVNGRAEFRIGDNGEYLIDITSNGRTLTFVTDKVPYVSTGFVPERTPGAAWGTTPLDTALTLQTRLQKLADTAAEPLKTTAERALAELRQTPMVSAHDLTKIPTILRDAKLRAAMDGDPAVHDAIVSGDAVANWEKLVASDDPKNPHVFYGDDANLGVEQAKRSNNWVIAGTGGTGVSAAEIVLKNNLKAHVTMVGSDEPAGLMENDQFRQLAEAYADAELAKRLGIPAPKEGRLTIRQDRVSGPMPVDRDAAATSKAGWVDESNIPENLRSKVLYDVNGTATHTEASAYVAALGRAEDYPPIVARLIDQARRLDPKFEINSHLKVTPNFQDRQYVGYTVAVTANKKTYTVDVTGAASRFMPKQDTSNMTPKQRADYHAARAAADWDAPAESGLFPGGFAPTASQTDRFANWREEQVKENER